MKHLLTFSILMAWSTLCFAQVAQQGYSVVVRGTLKGCEQSVASVLDVEEVTTSGQANLLGIPDISILGKTGIEIRESLASEVERLTGNRPDSITVMIYAQLPRNVFLEYRATLQALKETSCPIPIQKGAKQPVRGIDPNKYIEESIEKLRMIELMNSVA